MSDVMDFIGHLNTHPLSDSPSAIDDILEHVGVKGMKWGKRKSTSSTTPERSTERTVFEKSPKKLTSAELDKRIKRMETEKKYNELNKRDIGKGEQLVTEVLTNAGRTIATTLITNVGLYAVRRAITRQMGGGANAAATAAAITRRGK